MNGGSRGFELWAWLAFALGGLTTALWFYLGLRPGGTGPVLAYQWGPFALGAACAVLMLGGLIWSLRVRPVLQRGRAWPLAVLGASLWFCSLPISYPSSHEGKFSPSRLRLPFVGRARVILGGEGRATNPLLFDPARRFGVGFEALDATQLVVAAPADACVALRQDGRAGMVLALETRSGEFCVLAGLDASSSAPAVGQTVAAGEILGRASGRLVMHLQDRPPLVPAEGIPLRFWSYAADARAVEVGVPVPPQEVENMGFQPASAPGR